MAEKPIIFSGQMVRAILDDRKTHTRRVLKKQGTALLGYIEERNTFWFKNEPISFEIKSSYQKGDHLWVKETWAWDEDDYPVIFYKATDHPTCGQPWRSPLFMPKVYARLWLEVLGVKVERLQDISEEDAKAEGVAPWFPKHEELLKHTKQGGSYRNGFHRYWDTIHKKKPEFQWQANPWVWVYEFRRITL